MCVCHVFSLGCPLNAIALGGLNKAHVSKDTCWDAFWRAFGLSRPWRTKEELCKPHSSWRLQNYATYKKVGSYENGQAACMRAQSPGLGQMALITGTPSPQLWSWPPAGVSAPSNRSKPSPLSSSPCNTSVDKHLMFKAKGCRDLVVLPLSPGKVLPKSRTGPNSGTHWNRHVCWAHRSGSVWGFWGRF